MGVLSSRREDDEIQADPLNYDQQQDNVEDTVSRYLSKKEKERDGKKG